jgi:hypothetical protein
MWALNRLIAMVIKLNYKYSTMKFTKYFIDSNLTNNNKIPILQEYGIDNKNLSLGKVKSNSTNNNSVQNNSISSQTGFNKFSLY